MIASLLLNGDERDAHGDVRLDSGAVLGLQWREALHRVRARLRCAPPVLPLKPVDKVGARSRARRKMTMTVWPIGARKSHRQAIERR